MRNSSPRTGLALAIVIVMVVLTFVCVVTAFILLGEMYAIQDQIASVKAQTVDVRQKQVDAVTDMKTACDRAGWPVPEAEDPSGLPKPKTAEATQFRDERREKIKAAYNRSALANDVTLQELIRELALELNRAQDQLDFVKTEKNLADKALEKAKERFAPIQQIKEDQITRNDADIQRYNEKIKTITDESEKLMAQLNQEVTEVSTKKDEEEKKHADQMIKNRNKKNDLIRQIEELKRAEVIESTLTYIQGKLVEPDVPNRMAFINLGSRDRVVKGLKFLVGRPGTGLQTLYKGEVEVKRVWPTQSQVSITRVFDDGLPLVHGDLLYNPVFHTRREPRIVFAGDKRGRTMKYDIDEATRRLREIGTAVDDGKNLVSVDFVITTENYETDPLYLRAVELGIPILTAVEVFRVLGD